MKINLTEGERAIALEWCKNGYDCDKGHFRAGDFDFIDKKYMADFKSLLRKLRKKK